MEHRKELLSIMKKSVYPIEVIILVNSFVFAWWFPSKTATDVSRGTLVLLILALYFCISAF